MMRRGASIFLILAWLLLLPVAFAAEEKDALDDLLGSLLKVKTGLDRKPSEDVILFTGKYVNYGPEINRGNNFSGVTNLRYWEGSMESRLGMTAKTGNTPTGAGDITNIFYAGFENSPEKLAATRQPSGTSIWTFDSSFDSSPRANTSGTTQEAKLTSCLVNGTFVISDGAQISMYSGQSAYPTALLELPSGTTTYIDRYPWIFDGTQHTVVSGNTLFVGFPRPFDGVKADKDDAAFVIASGVTPQFYDGKMRYWSTWQVSTGNSTIELPKIQTAFREIESDWDGNSWMYAQVFQFQKSGVSPIADYSNSVVDDESEETCADISGMQTGGKIVLGFTYPPRIIDISLPEEFKNKTTSGVSPYYWNGTTTTLVTGFTDGTSHNSVALAQKGLLELPRITDWEPKRVGQSPIPYYTLELRTSATLSEYVRIDSVKAIPDSDSPSSDFKGKMVAEGHGRLFVANGRDLRKVMVSAEGQPDCFTGTDAKPEDDPLYIGKQEPMIWMGQVGERFFFLKQTENWTLTGVNPSTWAGGLSKITGKPPCIATQSVIPIQLGAATSILYVAASGIYDLLGNGIPLSRDIGAYFEPGNAMAITSSHLKDIIGWYDPDHYEAHFLNPHTNLELVYNLALQKWSVFSRNNALALTSGAYFVNNENTTFHLGAGRDGKVYELEKGSNDAGYQMNSGIAIGPTILKGGGVSGKSRIRAMAMRYELPGGQTSLSGNSIYLTGSISDNATEYRGNAFTLDEDLDSGFMVFDFNGLDGARSGFNHKFRFDFPGRIALQALIVRSFDFPAWTQSAAVPTTVPTTTTTTTTTTTSLAPATGLVFHNDGKVFHSDGEVFHDF